MEEYTGRERSPPPDPAESAAAEIPVPNSPTPTGRTFQDNFNSPQMPASPTGGQGLTQEALIEVLRNQHQNIVQQQNLIAGQGAQISELTKLVSGLVQMQTDVLKDQAQREADERERKAEEEKKAAEEAATSSTPRTGSLFTSAPKKSDSKYSGSSGGKMESYIPNCPQLEIKDSGRRHEINTWLSFRERFGSWLCLVDECYAAELQEAVKQTTTIEQGKLAPEAAVRSSKLYHWMKQAMSGYKGGLDLAVLQEREQGGLTCGYELFRRINNLLGVTTRAEALSLREAVMRLDVNGLKQLGCPSAGSIKNPLDTCLFLTQEFARLRDQCAAFADLQMMEVDQIMVMMRCLPQEIHRHLAFHGKSSTLRELMVVPVRDLKIASPIRFVAGLGMLCEIPNSKSGVKPDRIERLPNDLSKPQKLVDLPIHEGEPPWYWSEVNKTSRCPACSNGSETGHSVKCRNRYKKYLEEEYKRIVPIEDESSVPVVPEGLEEGLDTEGKPESQQESGERVPESESEREKRNRKSIDDEWDRFHREHEEKETGERFPEFDDVPFHAPKGQEADTEPTPMQEDPTNPYEIGKNPEPIEDDRMSEGYEPTEVPEGYRAPESPGESPMDIDLFQKIPRRGKNRNHDHWEVDLDKLVLRRVHHRSRKCVFAASSLPLPTHEDQLVGIQRTYYVDAVDERPVDEIPRDQFKVHVSEFGTQTAPLRRHWKGFTELPIKQLYMYDHQGNAIASLSDLGKELWEKVKDPLSRCSDDEVERFLSSVQEGVLEYSRKVPKETEESKFDAKVDSCKVWFGGRWIVLRKRSRATSDIGS